MSKLFSNLVITGWQKRLTAMGPLRGWGRVGKAWVKAGRKQKGMFQGRVGWMAGIGKEGGEWGRDKDPTVCHILTLFSGQT